MGVLVLFVIYDADKTLRHIGLYGRNITVAEMEVCWRGAIEFHISHKLVVCVTNNNTIVEITETDGTRSYAVCKEKRITSLGI